MCLARKCGSSIGASSSSQEREKSPRAKGREGPSISPFSSLPIVTLAAFMAFPTLHGQMERGHCVWSGEGGTITQASGGLLYLLVGLKVFLLPYSTTSSTTTSHSQLPKTRGQDCQSMGKSLSIIGQRALIVNLEEERVH